MSLKNKSHITDHATQGSKSAIATVYTISATWAAILGLFSQKFSVNPAILA
jgi:hypothetical protein